MNKNNFQLLLLLTFSLIAFSQITFAQNAGENRPKAYLVSRGKTQEEITRPRIVSTGENRKPVNQSKQDFRLEREVFDLINEQRLRVGLKTLEWSDEVAAMARLHSENMAKFSFFSHTDLDGLMVNDRADALGIKRWRAIGENIAYNRGYENPAASAVERWMQSPGHRDNLLNNRWKESGIGIAVTENGTYYFTEVFISRR